jgi:hypothetical protein
MDQDHSLSSIESTPKMAQAGVQDVFFVFVQGADDAEHCFPNLSRSQVDNVRTLRRAVQVRLS